MRLLDTGEPTPPLGLGPEPALVEHPWGPSARLLLYTDGLVEARNRRGSFFPLDEQASALVGVPLAEALDKVVDRLRDFAGGRIADDVALVLAENRAT
jgi:serine phosphatase RsbU (regulator of sigma subunit)